MSSISDLVPARYTMCTKEAAIMNTQNEKNTNVRGEVRERIDRKSIRRVTVVRIIAGFARGQIFLVGECKLPRKLPVSDIGALRNAFRTEVSDARLEWEIDFGHRRSIFCRNRTRRAHPDSILIPA